MKRLLVALLVLSACHKSPLGPDIAKSIVLPANGVGVMTAENQFTLDLFHAVNAMDTTVKNKLISPFSVYMALGMADNGAAGSTLDSIDGTLRLGSLSLDDLNQTSTALIQQFPTEDREVTMSVANSEWYDKTMAPLTSFTTTVQKDYMAQVQALDFSDPSSVTTINQWVAGATQNMIPKIISEINAGETLFLINAIYFKGSWTTAFEASDTRNEYFTRADGVQEMVPTMTLATPVNYPYMHNDSVTVVELPYGGGNYVMDVLEPSTGMDIRTLAASLTPGRLGAWVNQLAPLCCDITLPRFKFGYNVDTMASALTAMGMGIAFTGAANFSKMYGVPAHIDRVVHDAAIDVDETGTKAAAATATGTTSTAVPAIMLVQLNHTFLFTIREKTSGAVLFIGMLNDPLATSN
jgi:serpin B